MLIIQMSSIFIAEVLYTVKLLKNYILCFFLTVFSQIHRSSFNSLSPSFRKTAF